MKKFIIISVILLLLAAGAFGYAMYHYLQVNHLLGKQSETAAEATEAAASDESSDKDATDPADVAPTSEDIFAEGVAKAEAYAADMTTEQMAGQLVVGVCSDATAAADEMNRYSLAGMLFESGNFQGMSAEEISAALAAASNDAKIKPILAAQEEGGTYTTLSDLSAYADYDFNSPRTEYDTNGLQGIEKAETDKAELLKSAGFNMNLSPVVDLAASGDQLMYSRSISDNVETVSDYAVYAAKFIQPKKISVTLSHFPGCGTISDSAVTGSGAIEDDRSADTIRNTDYKPFKAGIDAGAHFVMVSNVLVKSLDPTHTAALSASIHKELRDDLGFTGLIITDLLDDADYSAYADGKKPAVQAVLAGNNLILVRDYDTAYNDIVAAVKDGTISESQLKEACIRVLAYKYTVGIMK